MTVRDEVSIAGVPWPVYKLLALAIGFIVLVIVAVATTQRRALGARRRGRRHRGVAGPAAPFRIDCRLGRSVLQQPLQRRQVRGDRGRVGIELRVRHPGPPPHREHHLAARLPTPPGTTRIGL